MADLIKEIKTRVALRTGDYAYWTTGAGKDIELYKGEVCICTVAKADNQAQTAPTVLFKVADANGKKFADLDWCSALAADVHLWAKKSQEDFITWVNTVVEHPVIDTGVMSVKATGDSEITMTPTTAANGDVTVTAAHAAHAEGNANTASTSSISGYGSTGTIRIPKIVTNAAGHVTEITEETVSIELPAEQSLPSKSDYGVLEIQAGSGIEIIVNDDPQRPTVQVPSGCFDEYGTAENRVSEFKSELEDGTFVPAAALNATHADAATKVDNSLIIKVGGADVEFDGSAAKTANVDSAIAAGVAEAKKYADDNDANTEYHVEYDSTNKKIKLVAGADASKMEIPTDDFIKDGMISSVAISEDGKNLVITWNSDAGKDVTNIPLTELVDIMTGVDGTTVTVNVSADDKISAEVKTNSLKDGHIASDAAIAKGKLAADVQASLGKADTAVQPGDVVNYDITVGATQDLGFEFHYGNQVKEIELHFNPQENASEYGFGDLAFKATVETDDIVDKNVTEAKLEQNVQDALALARTALQADEAAEKYLTVEAFENSDGLNITVDGTIELKSEISIEKISSPSGFEIAATGGINLNTSSEFSPVTVNGKEVAIKENTATAAQGQKADSALQSIAADTGLKVSAKADNSQTISIDTDVVFILNCNF